MNRTATVGRESVNAGQAGYTPKVLRLYNNLVFNFTMPVLWRCKARHLAAHYERHVSLRHLDIGVGTGYLLNQCDFGSATPQITLMDLNPNSLDHAAHTLRRYAPLIHRGNILDPWQLPPQAFDSVGMANVLHCVPGNLRDKGVVFEYGSRVLVPGGVLFGATVLGEASRHSRRSTMALRGLNRRGAFHNGEDRLEDLEEGLSRAFTSYRVDVQGSVALFAAWLAR